VVVALVFAVHPVQVESVAWISQRKTVLSSLLAVGSILCYLRSGGMRRTRWLAASLALYAVGGLAKPTVVLLPLVLPLMDVWPLRRRLKGGLLEKLPFFICMLVMARVAFVSQASSPARLLAPTLSSAGVAAKTVGLACYNLMLYVGNLVWPMSLSPYRAIPRDPSFGSVEILLSVFGTIALAAVCLGAYRRSKALFAGMASFVILLLPALGTFRFVETCVADRFLYLPVVFLTLPLAVLLRRIEQRVPHRVALVRVCIVLFFVPLVILMRAQQGVWHDSRALWTHVAKTVPNLAKGHAQLAKQQLESGAFEQALSHARRALEIEPENAGYLHVLGRSLVRTGRPEEAVPVIEQAIAGGLGPIEPLAHVSLAEALLATGDAAGARATCERAIGMGRGQVGTYTMMGDAAMQFARNYEAAADYYRLVLKHQPDNATIRWNLGTALEYCGLDAEALEEYKQVLAVCARQGVRPPEAVLWAVQKVQRRLSQRTTQPAEG
jgi:Flp pilus assembly protein TadD